MRINFKRYISLCALLSFVWASFEPLWAPPRPESDCESLIEMGERRTVNVAPQGKPDVWVTLLPADQQQQVDEIRELFLKQQDERNFVTTSAAVVWRPTMAEAENPLNPIAATRFYRHMEEIFFLKWTHTPWGNRVPQFLAGLVGVAGTLAIEATFMYTAGTLFDLPESGVGEILPIVLYPTQAAPLFFVTSAHTINRFLRWALNQDGVDVTDGDEGRQETHPHITPRSWGRTLADIGLVGTSAVAASVPTAIFVFIIEKPYPGFGYGLGVPMFWNFFNMFYDIGTRGIKGLFVRAASNPRDEVLREVLRRQVLSMQAHMAKDPRLVRKTFYLIKKRLEAHQVVPTSQEELVDAILSYREGASDEVRPDATHVLFAYFSMENQKRAQDIKETLAQLGDERSEDEERFFRGKLGRLILTPVDRDQFQVLCGRERLEALRPMHDLKTLRTRKRYHELKNKKSPNDVEAEELRKLRWTQTQNKDIPLSKDEQEYLERLETNYGTLDLENELRPYDRLERDVGHSPWGQTEKEKLQELLQKLENPRERLEDKQRELWNLSSRSLRDMIEESLRGLEKQKTEEHDIRLRLQLALYAVKKTRRDHGDLKEPFDKALQPGNGQFVFAMSLLLCRSLMTDQNCGAYRDPEHQGVVTPPSEDFPLKLSENNDMSQIAQTTSTYRWFAERVAWGLSFARVPIKFICYEGALTAALTAANVPEDVAYPLACVIGGIVAGTRALTEPEEITEFLLELRTIFSRSKDVWALRKIISSYTFLNGILLAIPEFYWSYATIDTVRVTKYVMIALNSIPDMMVYSRYLDRHAQESVTGLVTSKPFQMLPIPGHEYAMVRYWTNELLRFIYAADPTTIGTMYRATQATHM